MNPDDVLESDTNSVDTYVVRGAVMWKPTSSLSLTPSVFYQNRHQNNIDDYWVGLSDPDDGDYRTATPENMADRDHFELYSLKGDYDLGGVELITNTSFFDRRELVQDYSATLYDLSYFQGIMAHHFNPDFESRCTGGLCHFYRHESNMTGKKVPPLLTADGLDLPGYDSVAPFGHYEATNNVTNTQSNFTQEVRLQSTDENARLTWIVGVFYSNQSQLSVEEINDPQLPALTEYLWGLDMLSAWGEDLLPNGDDYINHTRGHEHQMAAFANATYAIIPDELKLQLGARFASHAFRLRQFLRRRAELRSTSGRARQEGRNAVHADGESSPGISTTTIWSMPRPPRAIASAAPIRCSRSSACTEITEEPESYDSDSVWSYELGTKDKFFGGRLQASGSVYYLKWNNIQQTVALPSCGFRYTTNQGGAVSKGFDLRRRVAAARRSRYRFQPRLHRRALHQHERIRRPRAGAMPGDKLPGSPWSFSLGAQYTRTLWSLESYFRVDYEYASREIGLTPERDGPVDGAGGTTLFDKGLEPEPATNVVEIRAGATVQERQFRAVHGQCAQRPSATRSEPSGQPDNAVRSDHLASAHVRSHRDVPLLSG